METRFDDEVKDAPSFKLGPKLFMRITENNAAAVFGKIYSKVRGGHEQKGFVSVHRTETTPSDSENTHWEAKLVFAPETYSEALKDEIGRRLIESTECSSVLVLEVFVGNRVNDYTMYPLHLDGETETTTSDIEESRGTPIIGNVGYHELQIKVCGILDKAQAATIYKIQHCIYLAFKQGKALGYRDGFHDRMMGRLRLKEPDGGELREAPSKRKKARQARCR